jgi:transcription elongation factor
MQIKELNGTIEKHNENVCRIKTKVFMKSNKKIDINILLEANTTIGRVENDENKCIIFKDGQMIINESYDVIELIINELE